MAIGATAVWRIRVAGNDANGAGYDPGIPGAGTDYTQQDAAQASWTTALSMTGTTNLNDTTASGLFTSAMVGNAVRVNSLYYFITAFVDSNNVTVDRSDTFTTLSGKLGGAAASLKQILDASNATHSKAVAGNYVYIRGSGSDTPSSSDYTIASTGFSTVPGNTTDGSIFIIGENGRPFITSATNTLVFNASSYLRVSNLYLKSQAGTNAPILNCSHSTFQNIVVDMNNIAGTVGIGLTATGMTIVDCEVFSHRTAPTGTTATGILINATLARVLGCLIHHVGGFGVDSTNALVIEDCIIYANKNINLRMSTLNGWTIKNNTIDAGESHGIRFLTVDAFQTGQLYNNIISNHTAVGAFGVSLNGLGTTVVNDKLKRFHDYNNYYNNTSDRENFSAGVNDLALDPGYVNASALNFTPGSNMKSVGFPGLFRNSVSTSHVDLGAVQRIEPASAGGASSHAGRRGF